LIDLTTAKQDENTIELDDADRVIRVPRAARDDAPMVLQPAEQAFNLPAAPKRRIGWPSWVMLTRVDRCGAISSNLDLIAEEPTF
jgi:hypothetical protein